MKIGDTRPAFGTTNVPGNSFRFYFYLDASLGREGDRETGQIASLGREGDREKTRETEDRSTQLVVMARKGRIDDVFLFLLLLFFFALIPRIPLRSPASSAGRPRCHQRDTRTKAP